MKEAVWSMEFRGWKVDEQAIILNTNARIGARTKIEYLVSSIHYSALNIKYGNCHKLIPLTLN
jgi:hypothetical protein